MIWLNLVRSLLYTDCIKPSADNRETFQQYFSTMKHYTQIPDTSDNEYWEIKANDGQLRSQTFIPRDKELHRQLKLKAWAAIQAA